MRQPTPSIILPAVLLLLLGCKHGGTGEPSPGRADAGQTLGASQASTAAVRASAPGVASSPADAPDAALAHDARPLIVCFGDSLTAGYGTDPGESYPDFLQRDLDRAGDRYRVVNEGVSGNTTKDGVERVSRVVALHPAVVVVEFGGNDGLRGLRIADTRANLDRILAALTAAKIKVALAGITLPPDYGPDYIHEFNGIYPELARRYRVPYLPFLLQGVFGNDGMMQPDRTHATAAGNEIVARNVETLLRPLLSR